MVHQSKNKFSGGVSLTGTMVKGSSCQHTGRRRGREKVNTSNPTE